MHQGPMDKWLGTSVEVDSDKIKILTEKNQCYAMQEIDNILKISQSIKLLVKMKKICILFYGKK